RPNKMGSQTRDPITQVLERSGRPILSRGHRLVLSYWRWFGLLVFEGDDFLCPRAQLRVMLFCVFGRKPIDRGKSIRFRCCGDFRPRDNRFPRKPQNDHCDWISRRFRPAERLCADDTRVEACQFPFGHLSRPLDVVLRISLRSRGCMSIHQQIAEARPQDEMWTSRLNRVTSTSSSMPFPIAINIGVSNWLSTAPCEPCNHGRSDNRNSRALSQHQYCFVLSDYV